MQADAIDICVCTFRRPHVAETLKSLSRLELPPGRTVRVIVADNDETPSACELVEKTAAECSLNVTYIHAPARNISVARNACLDAIDAPLAAFIDDDETANPPWLTALLGGFAKYSSDVVLGQVQAVYGPECADWMRDGDFHSIKPVWVKGEIRTGYSCNVLFRPNAKALEGLRFREELGRSGGEDTVFFATVHKNGGKISYAADAIVKEPVVPARANFLWLLKRWFRSGQTHGLFLLEKDGTSLPMRVKNLLVASAKALFCLGGAAIRANQPHRWRYWILRGSLHAGVVARLLGKRDLQAYGG